MSDDEDIARAVEERPSAPGGEGPAGADAEGGASPPGRPQALADGQVAALMMLADIPRRAAFVPTHDQRADFQALVALGLARSRGQGLGGEGFASTPAGLRAAKGDLIAALRPKLPRGFAVMAPERRREISRLGGGSVPADKRAFSRDRALASEAGRAGGQARGDRSAEDAETDD
jgi:general stress protein YciG